MRVRTIGCVVLGVAGCVSGGPSDEIPNDQAIGSECVAPVGGDATFHGIPAGGASLAVAARHVDLTGDFPDIILSASFDNSPSGGCDGGSLSWASPSVELMLTPDDLTLGSHLAVDPATDDDGLRISVGGYAAASWARAGWLELTGYDPSTGSLCGEFTATLTDDTVIEGEFRARPITYSPPSTSLCGPDEEDDLAGCNAGGDAGVAGVLLVVVALTWSRRRRANPG
jgi:uncharacterized protein (TIGR03382 family)